MIVSRRYKPHKRSTLKNMTKGQLVELVAVLEQNVENLNDTLDIQYYNAIKMVNDITDFQAVNNKRNKEKLAL